jgi:hypothetical protein
MNLGQEWLKRKRRTEERIESGIEERRKYHLILEKDEWNLVFPSVIYFLSLIFHFLVTHVPSLS